MGSGRVELGSVTIEYDEEVKVKPVVIKLQQKVVFQIVVKLGETVPKSCALLLLLGGASG